MSSGVLDIDKLLDSARKCVLIDETDMQKLCDLVVSYLIEEPNIQIIRAPVTICGDIHGQFFDLLRLFENGGRIEDGTNYLFLGDYVDRGRHSLETLTLLLLLKAKFPDRITLLRGNHESRQITQVYGFYDECQQKYGNANVWKYCCQVFDFMNIAALVDGRVLCVHGGLSPDLVALDQIQTIMRAQEVPHQGPLCDLVWSDPEDLEKGTWAVSPRGAGYLFGNKVTLEFNQINNLTLICRAHQLVQEGYKFMFPERAVVTIWSAPNYCYRCGNVASILKLDEDLTPTDSSFIIFDAVNEPPLGFSDPAQRKLFMSRIGRPVNSFNF